VETADEVARLAGECAIIRRAVALARWVGPEGKALTRVGVLRKPAVPAACAAIGIRVPERFRSAADVQHLHRPWTAALALGVLAVARDRAVAGPELDGWPEEGASARRWLDALRAVCGDITGGAADASLGLLVLALALLRSLSAGVGLSSREVIDAAQAIADECGLGLMQVHVLGGVSALSRGFLVDHVESLLGLLTEFGAVTAGREPTVTPLGAWAMERLDAELPRAVGPGAEAAEAITAVAMAAAADRWHIAQGWLGSRKPADAVRELLKAADPLPAWLRDAAATIGEMTGEDGLPGWQAIAGNSAAWPNSARLARAELYDWGQAPEPSPEERAWLGAEAAAAALPARGEAWPEGCGPDEALCRLWEAAGGGPLDIGALLAMVRATGHPEAEAVAVAVAELVESGAALTAAQVVDLKVTLWRSSPPLWRTVRMPLAATLGDLHRAIQVLFGWDGDHLHAFTVADVGYSDPFFDLEETADEEAVRLRDAFPTSARKPVRYEYDFGAGWVHEVTRMGSSRLAPGEAVPRCLSFSGDNPVEYWNEDEPVNPAPFNMAKVNAALADRV
jgi:Plasmid pRiA4b ORF-3-like protein